MIAVCGSVLATSIAESPTVRPTQAHYSLHRLHRHKSNQSLEYIAFHFFMAYKVEHLQNNKVSVFIHLCMVA